MNDTKSNQRKSATQERSKITVNSIITATNELLKEYKITDLTTSKIIEKAGVSVGSLYQYFSSKDSILTTVLQKQLNKDVDLFLANLESTPSSNLALKDAITSLIGSLFDNFKVQTPIQRQLIFSVISLHHLRFTLDNDERVNKAIKNYLLLFKDELRQDLELDRTIFILQYMMKGIKFGILFANKESMLEGIKKDLTDIIFGYIKK